MCSVAALTVSLIAEAEEIFTCDCCGRNENSPRYDNPNAPLLTLYLIGQDDREFWEIYVCESCLDSFLRDWEEEGAL